MGANDSPLRAAALRLSAVIEEIFEIERQQRAVEAAEAYRVDTLSKSLADPFKHQCELTLSNARIVIQDEGDRVALAEIARLRAQQTSSMTPHSSDCSGTSGPNEEPGRRRNAQRMSGMRGVRRVRRQREDPLLPLPASSRDGLPRGHHVRALSGNALRDARATRAMAPSESPAARGRMSNSNTADIDDHFFEYIKDVADDVLCRPFDLMSVMFSESGVRHDAWNNNPQSMPPEKRYNASGINQMMPATLMGLGFGAGHAAFRALSATEQLTWVERYFRSYRGKLVSIGALYTANFLPAYVDRAKDPSFVLTAKNGFNGWAFAPNATFDENGDLMITVGELEDAVKRNCSGPRWAELVARLSGDVVSPELGNFDLGTVQGAQAALDRLGYDVGTVDGIPGPKTTAAVFKFQADHNLTADGIYGPKTRLELQAALDTAE